MGARTWAVVAAATTMVVSVGCRQIVGIGDPVFDGSTGTGGAGSSATSGAVGSGGTGGSGACKVTHPGGGTCEYLPGQACGCSEAGQKCTVIDPTTGESACLTAGTTPDYDACTSTTDCEAGSWCELSTSVCEPICAGPCTGGMCVHALEGTTSAMTIPGLDVCSVSCNLVSGSPCGPSATCVESMTGASVTTTACFKSAGATEGMNCASPQDCAAGLLCTENPSSMNATCSSWCTPPDGTPGDCSDGICTSLSTDVDIDGTQYGYCNSM